MRSFIAAFGLLTLAAIAGLANNPPQSLEADDTTVVEEQITVEVPEPVEEVVTEEPEVFIQLPTEQETIYVDDALSSRIDTLQQRFDQEAALQSQINDATINRIQNLEAQLLALNTSVPQLGRVEALESTLNELQDRVERIENPPVVLPDPVNSTLAEWRSPSRGQYVLLFTTTNCGPCDKAKAEWVPWLEEQNWPVQVFEPNDPVNDEFNTQTYPTWIVLEYGEEEARWTGISQSEMEERMNYVASHGEYQTTFTAPQFQDNDLKSWIANNYSSSEWGGWDAEGSMYSHLIYHGWTDSDLRGLSERELHCLHDATHTGRISPPNSAGSNHSHSSSSSYSYSSSSGCRDGSCTTRREIRRMNRRNNNFGWSLF